MKLSLAPTKQLDYATDGSAKNTKVFLVNSEGASLPVLLPPDSINLSNTELENMALEVLYQENFPMKYENEKFNTITNNCLQNSTKISKQDEYITALQKRVTDLETKVKNISRDVNVLADVLYKAKILTDEDVDRLTSFVSIGI